MLENLGDSQNVLSNCIFTQSAINADIDKNKAKGNIKLYNYTGNPYTFKVYLAVYDEGTLVGLNVLDKDLIVSPDDKIVEFVTSELAYNEGNEIKLFVWKEDGITPVLINQWVIK